MILKTTVGSGDEAQDVGLVWDETTGAAVPFGETENTSA